MNAPITGILPVLPTPFTATGDVDLDAMVRLVDYACRSGVDGVVFPGFASEVEHLTGEERQALLEKVVQTSAEKVQVVAGASAEMSADVIAYGRGARSLGVNWLMVQPPKSLGSGAAEVIGFLREVTAQLPDARIILQNAPAPRGSDLSPEAILDIAEAVPQVRYVKEETLPAGPAITAILKGRSQNLLGVIGGGGARYILDEYERGACAAMPAIEIAEEHVAMDAAWRTGDRPAARDLYVRTLPLLTLQAIYRMRLTKHAMVRRGILENAVVRAPTPALDEFALADIDANLAELGIIDAVSA
ncbi:MAG: dihydrodipicolinate synthase family protein [Pseudomonadota bacterium]